MIGEATTLYALAIIASALTTSAVAVAGMVSPRYRETLLENVALCAVAVAGSVVAMQTHAYGGPLYSGIVFWGGSVGAYALAAALKQIFCSRRMAT